MKKATIEFWNTSGRKTCKRVTFSDDNHLNNLIKFLEKKHNLTYDECFVWDDYPSRPA